ncbi:MAG: penicillin acylase family protein, partial [Bacteroidota bacterium]
GSLLIPAEVKSYISLQISTIIEELEKNSTHFGEHAIDKRNQLLQEAFVKAINNLNKKLGPSMDQWVYGQAKYKHSTMEHPLSAIVNNELKQQLNLGPLPRGGSGQTPGSTGGTDNQLSGASFRILIDTKDWDKALMINTPGQSGNPDSRYYRNLFETWANDQCFPAYYSKEKIKSVTKEWIILEKP